MTQPSSPEDGLQECGKQGPLQIPKPSADGSRLWLLEKNKSLSVHLCSRGCLFANPIPSLTTPPAVTSATLPPAHAPEPLPPPPLEFPFSTTGLSPKGPGRSMRGKNKDCEPQSPVSGHLSETPGEL